MIPQPVSKTAAFSMMLAKRYGTYHGFAFICIISRDSSSNKKGVDIKTEVWANMWRHEPRFPFCAYLNQYFALDQRSRCLSLRDWRVCCIVVL